MFNRLEQSVSAGDQFDGTIGKGRFEWPGDKSGVIIKRLDLVMGSEDKNWNIFIVSNDGDDSELEAGSGTVSMVSLVGEIPIARDERVEIRTSSAISDMRAVVVWEDKSSNLRDRR